MAQTKAPVVGTQPSFFLEKKNTNSDAAFKWANVFNRVVSGVLCGSAIGCSVGAIIGLAAAGNALTVLIGTGIGAVAGFLLGFIVGVFEELNRLRYFKAFEEPTAQLYAPYDSI